MPLIYNDIFTCKLHNIVKHVSRCNIPIIYSDIMVLIHGLDLDPCLDPCLDLDPRPRPRSLVVFLQHCCKFETVGFPVVSLLHAVVNLITNLSLFCVQTGLCGFPIIWSGFVVSFFYLVVAVYRVFRPLPHFSLKGSNHV